MNTPITLLSAAEALVLQNPQAAQGRAALKLTLMELLARRIVTMRHEETKGRFGRVHRTDYLQVAEEDQQQVPDAAPVTAVLNMLRAAGAAGPGATMAQVVQQARRSFGSDLSGFQQKHLVPSLLRRGLLEAYQKKLLGLIPRTQYRHTSAGEKVRQELVAHLEQARRLPEVLDRDPTHAAALLATLGGSILLVDELKPHYGRLAQALRQPAAGGDDGASADMVELDDPDVAPSDLDLADFGGFDFDFAAFEALDSSLDAFDSSFDSSADSGGGDSGSDSGGGSSD